MINIKSIFKYSMYDKIIPITKWIEFLQNIKIILIFFQISLKLNKMRCHEY